MIASVLINTTTDLIVGNWYNQYNAEENPSLLILILYNGGFQLFILRGIFCKTVGAYLGVNFMEKVIINIRFGSLLFQNTRCHMG